mmetsp:Transcript_46871/g.130591  ORF Transcript_46871/g.130591 Transcript_46871/m.130591 type:complete len:266 (-) Transcript_46871:282-1079(-)
MCPEAWRSLLGVAGPSGASPLSSSEWSNLCARPMGRPAAGALLLSLARAQRRASGGGAACMAMGANAATGGDACVAMDANAATGGQDTCMAVMGPFAGAEHFVGVGAPKKRPAPKPLAPPPKPPPTKPPLPKRPEGGPPKTMSSLRTTHCRSKAGAVGASGCCSARTGGRACVFARPTAAVDPDFVGRFQEKETSSSSRERSRPQSEDRLAATSGRASEPNTDNQRCPNATPVNCSGPAETCAFSPSTEMARADTSCSIGRRERR